jgi:hypothetical protein
MLVLALGRFTELGPWLTERGRHIAEWQGWYDDRRDIQETAVFALIALGGAAVAAGLIWSARASSREHPLAVTAVVYLVTFVGVRAISLHQIDRVLYTERAVGIRPNGVLEFAGTLLVGVAVLLALVPPRRGAPGGARSPDDAARSTAGHARLNPDGAESAGGGA